MTTFNLTAANTVGEAVTRHPVLARNFETARIDYCCGGKRTIIDVCKEKEIDPEVFLLSLKDSVERSRDEKFVDAAAMSLTELADHIESTHHAYLRSELPRLDRITERVATVHGGSDPRLNEVRKTFVELANEMMNHLTKEEKVLFPLIRQIDGGEAASTSHCGSIADPIRQMGVEHNDAGGALETLRKLTDHYSPPSWACNTYRAMLDSLEALERDLHMHVHKEDNVLFPQAVAREMEKSEAPAS